MLPLRADEGTGLLARNENGTTGIIDRNGNERPRGSGVHYVSSSEASPPPRWAVIFFSGMLAGSAASFFAACALSKVQGTAPPSDLTFLSGDGDPPLDIYPSEGKHHKKSKKHYHDLADPNDLLPVDWEPQESAKRCDWVVEHFTERDAGLDDEEKTIKYAVQSQDFNVFFRATASIFWLDFFGAEAGGGFGGVTFDEIDIDATLADGTKLDRRAAWTWVTGDQHLSNFGAWRNRHGEVVFGVNDFDEAAVFDFHVDVARIAVSICNHAFSNGFSHHIVKRALLAFTGSYLEAVVNYVDNEKALLYELTPETATGKLREFLIKVRDDKTPDDQLEKFTEVDANGVRKFLKNDGTKLAEVSSETLRKVREAFTSQRYGATMMKVGWQVRHWDDDYFSVLDVAARLNTGVGSFGVDRYYILLKGQDTLLGEDEGDGASIILDVKYEPTPAVEQVLDADDKAWYNVKFPNRAARVVTAQRKLTSYSDPFTGWIDIDGDIFYIRQRSPWKKSFKLEELTDEDDFIDFVEQIGIATATSHVRGTQAKSPGQFKEVVAAVIGQKWSNERKWSAAVARIAMEYSKQVRLDFKCFEEYTEKNYPLGGNSTRRSL